jgi:hypothetical protein
MPSSRNILEGLSAIANQWQSLAIAWHAVVGALLIGLLLGWRPSRRLVGLTIALSLASVGALAWTAGNPFNGIVFGALSVTLAVVALRFPSARIVVQLDRFASVGGGLLVFGWLYPHFLKAGWISYVYAAPLGLIPCPTLAAAIGLTLIVGLSESRIWKAILAMAGIVYGLVGVFRLGVPIDLILIAGGVVLAVAAPKVCAARSTPPARLSHAA